MKNIMAIDNLEVTDTFVGGVYARSIRIPKDTFIVGSLHRLDNFNIMTEGRLLLQTIANGIASDVEEVVAPYYSISKAGTMKIAIALEDTVWTSMSNTDVEEENIYTKEESEQFYLKNKGIVWLGL